MGVLRRRKLLFAAGFCAVSLLAFVLWRALRLPRLDAPEALYDSYTRLVAFPGKIAVACPRQDARTAIIIAIGQSNIANFAARLYQARHGDRVVNFFDGACARAGSPLLGASAPGGESLTMLADKLIDAGLYDRVVLVPAGIGGQTAANFARGQLRPMLERVAAALQWRYKPTQILWHRARAISRHRRRRRITRVMF
jgi:hypothetical protein